MMFHDKLTINSYLTDRISDDIFEQMFVTSHVSFFKDIWLCANFRHNFDKRAISNAK
jgi:hypothetical protein